MKEIITSTAEATPRQAQGDLERQRQASEKIGNVIERCELRAFAPAPADLRDVEGGWVYRDSDERGSRVYRLTATEGYRGTLQCWVSGHYWWAQGDLSIAWYRHDTARGAAREDLGLEVVVKDDLYSMWRSIQFEMIDVELRQGLEEKKTTRHRRRRSA